MVRFFAVPDRLRGEKTPWSEAASILNLSMASLASGMLIELLRFVMIYISFYYCRKIICDFHSRSFASECDNMTANVC